MPDPTFGWADMPDYRGWVPGDPPIPLRTSFIEADTIGDRLLLSGRVLTRSGTPMANVKLEFWQANAAGQYDLSAAFKLRGVQRTRADGAFRVETILPGAARGGIPHIDYLAMAFLPTRKQPPTLRAAVCFATETELDRAIAPEDRHHVGPNARIYRDDAAYLSLDKLPLENGVRHATYDIVFDIA